MAARELVGAGGGGKGGGGGSSHVPSEDPNTLRSNALARLIDLVSEGPIAGLANGNASIFLDGTPLEDSGGHGNFSGITVSERTGLPDQDYIPGFAAAENTLIVNTEVTASAAVVRTLSGPLDAARIILSVPQLSYQDSKTGDLHGSSVTLVIARRVSGMSTWTDVRTVTIGGKCVSPYQAAYRIELGGASDWDIRVTRVTADSGQVNLVNKTWWQATVVLTDGKFSYPDSACYALAVDAKQFGSSVPVRSYDVKGLLVRVPSNYDPVTRAYDGIWDGTFDTAWTDNPAWVFYDLLTNRRYGLGAFVAAAQVDKWSLYEIARYCDETVPDGFGGQEPRYRFNYQITAREDVYKVLQAVASSFRGLTFWGSGAVYAVADRPSDPIKLVTPANVRDGLFTYEGTALSSRHSVVMVTWFDPGDQCRPAIELVEDADLIARYGWRTLELTAYGCTSRGQAHRMGKWALDTEKYATQTVSYEAAWDHMDAAPGDIIEVYDPSVAGLRLGGRLAAATSTSVTVDAAVTIETGKSYTLKLVMPDGTLASRPLTNSAGASVTLTFTEELEVLPLTGALWGVAVNDLAPRQFRVLSLKELDNGFFVVTALLHDPTKYARVEQGIKLDPLPYTRAARTRPDPPTNLTLAEYVYRYATGLRSAATLSWSPPASESLVQGYEIQRRRPNDNWESLGITAITSFDVQGCEAGDWEFRVRSLGFNGLSSAWLSRSLIIFARATTPGDVEGFALHVLGDIATLSWAANTDLFLSHYRLRFAPVTTGATWDSAADLLPRVAGISVQVPTMIGTYLIKAVSTDGTESLNAALVVTTVESVAARNAVATLGDAPDWGGTHTDTIVVDETLQLEVTAGLVAATGTYAFEDSFDLGAVYTSRLTALLTATGYNVGTTWESLGAWETLGPWVYAPAGSWAVRTQVQTTQDNPAASPTWSDWTDVVVGDYTARAFRFRLVLESFDPAVTPVVAAATVSVDMPDRVFSENNVSVPSGGKTVTFTPSFRTTPSVGITGQDLSSGDTFQYTAGPAATGFTIRFYDKDGNPVARTMDYIASGYGYAG